MLNKLNWKIVFLFFLFLIVIIISSNESEAAWQRCVDYHPQGYKGIYALWDGKWYWYADSCYAPPWQSYVQLAYCSGNAPYSKPGNFCTYGCGNGACNSPPAPRCDENDCDRNDKWYETSNTKWVPAGECKEKEQKLSEYRDYSCSGATCAFAVTNNNWVDTGQIRNIAGCVIAPVAPKTKKVLLAKSGRTIECSAITTDYDLKKDGKVDMDDFGIFVDIFGTTNSQGDFNLNGKVDMDDLFCFQGEFGKVTEVTQESCIKTAGYGVNPDAVGATSASPANGVVDLEDFFALAVCYSTQPYSDPKCRKFDFDNDKKVGRDVNGYDYDLSCFITFFRKAFSCNAKQVCPDFNRNGGVFTSTEVTDTNSDINSFYNCFSVGSSSAECLNGFDYDNSGKIDANDFFCFGNDIGKKFEDVCNGAICSDSGYCPGNFYCSFGAKGFGTQGNCCTNGQYWDKNALPKSRCTGAEELGQACTCPFEQEAGTGKFKTKEGKYVTSKEFIANSACWAYKKACITTKRFSRSAEKRKLEVERYGK